MLHTADSCSRHFFRSFLSDKMFAVNRFVVAPNDTVSASAQNHSTRKNELAERPIGCCWLAAAFASSERDCRIADSRVCADTTAVIPEIAGSHRLLLVEIIAALAGTCLQFGLLVPLSPSVAR